MIIFKNLGLRRGAKVLFQQVDWTIYHKQRIGIIGANGTGKSSLLALLQGDLQCDEGALTMPPKLTFSHVAQEAEASQQAAIDYVMDGDEELRHLQLALSEAETDTEMDGMRIASLHQQLSEIDAYTAEARAAQLLVGLGFPHSLHQQGVSEFSGGWRVRLNLAKALMCRSDVLLLDEPTNHLDLDAILWLEQWLRHYPGTLLIISHDREFLDKTVDHIAYLANQKIKLFTGNYSTFESLLANELLLQQASFEKNQKKLEHLQSFVNRFRAKASKARQAQSRLKAIERMDKVCAVQSQSAFEFSFPAIGKTANPLISIKHANIAYDDKTIIHNLNLNVSSNDRIAIIGPNGAGKSSIIKLLAGEIVPATGERIVSPNLAIGYFAQHQVDYLPLEDNPLTVLSRIAKKASESELRKFLGGFGFSSDRVFEPIKIFSGGEKSRLALALIVWQKPNLLLLDEPTNHLDLEMRQALSLALQDYDGAMILVSHDRFLTRMVSDTLLLAANGELNDFDGDLDDYQRWLLEYRKLETAGSVTNDKAGNSRKLQRQQDAKIREERRPLLNNIKKFEAEMARLQQELIKIELVLAEPEMYEEAKKADLQACLLKQADVKRAIDSAEAKWLEACARLESFNIQ